jgi:hypothetical protein
MVGSAPLASSLGRRTLIQGGPQISWLNNAFSSSEPIIINEVMGVTLPLAFHHFRTSGQDFLVGVAIRDHPNALIGVVFVSSTQAQQRLSAAQTYALQTHAALMREMLTLQTGGIVAQDDSNIERLLTKRGFWAYSLECRSP